MDRCLSEDKTMKKAIYRIASLIMALVMILGNIVQTKAAGSVYYVSTTGSDSNPGTSAAPFRTFAKANSMLTAGSTLKIYAGVYTEPLRITVSGASGAGIRVQPQGGTVVIDRQNGASAGLEVRGSHVTVSGLEIRNVNDVCVNLLGSNITVESLTVHHCASHGIQANNSSNIKIMNSTVYNTVLVNAARTLSGGWGSGIKVRESNNVLIQGNMIAYNHGEGIGTRGTNVSIRGNWVYDNYSVNIYTNSENVWIENNFVVCTANSGFERNGLPASGINLAEEYYEGWGARLNNARVLNNIVAFCRNGIRYSGADELVIGGGLKNAVIAYNTLYGSTNAALSIAYETGQSGSLIANNIIWQAQNNLTAIDNVAGLTFQNNLWKVAPPAWMQSPGDQIGEPQFVTTPGYTHGSFVPAPSSPAASAAADISVTSDYYGKQRGPLFDIGAIQFSAEFSGATLESGGWYIFTRGEFGFGQQGDLPVPADYDGNGRDDLAVFRPSEGMWYVSSAGNFRFGEQEDMPVPGDYNGDGRADIAVYRPSNGTWYISTLGNFLFGERGDIPIPADYNGDGRTDVAVYRPSNGTWYISTRGNFVFGEEGDVPVPADYDGDGRDDIAVYRPSNGTWYISTRGNFAFGERGDIPVPGDYNGDGSDDIAVYRPSNGTWYISTRGNLLSDTAGYTPVPADYNGDGRDDIAVFRP
jgi:hypothetical protein